MGIVVDHRRRNLSEEGKKVNVERLKGYKTRLIVFPRKAGKPKKGDSSVSYLRYALWILSTELLNRLKTSRVLLHVLRFPSPTPSLQSPPERSLLKSVNSRRSGLSALPARIRDTKAHARSVRRRSVMILAILLFFD